jgi:nicotinamidase-related amidase
MMNNTSNGGLRVERRDRVALLVIDVQQGLFRKSTKLYKADELLATINGIVERAHAAGAPVFFIQHSSEKVLPWGSEDWQLHPALHPTGADRIIHTLKGNAFEGTELDGELAALGVGAVVVTGLVTHGCVKNSCIGAHDLGYRVVLVTDGHSSYSKDASKLIEEWNETLSHDIAELRTAGEVAF